MVDVEALLTAKARELGISLPKLREAIAQKIVETSGIGLDEDPWTLVLNLTKQDIERVN